MAAAKDSEKEQAKSAEGAPEGEALFGALYETSALGVVPARLTHRADPSA